MDLYSALAIPIASAFTFQIILSLLRYFGVGIPQTLFEFLFLVVQAALILYCGYFNVFNLSLFALLFSLVYFARKKSRFAVLLPLGIYVCIWIHFRYLAPTFSSPWILRLNDVLSYFIHPQFIVGTSYLAFRLISFAIDRKTYPAEGNSILAFLNWIFFFPALLSGPIHLYDDWLAQKRNRTPEYSEIITGIQRVIYGVLKNMVASQIIADVSAHRFTDGAISMLGYGEIFCGMLFYTIYIYLNFSGFTDIAIGIGRIWGIKLPENFNFPFFKRNIQEFWNSWHMSFIEWLRRYLFLPLLFSLTRKDKIVRISKHLPTYISLWVLFIAVALWHAWTINYLFWGVSNAIGLSLFHLLKSSFNWKQGVLKWWKSSNVGYFTSCLLTFCFTILTFGPLALTPYQFKLFIERIGIDAGVIECQTPDAYMEQYPGKVVTGREARCIYYSYENQKDENS